MVQRGRETTLEERIEIGERWEAGQTDPEIAAAMGRSVWTVRKWRRKYQREGRSGLASHMGRPPTGALGQFPLEMRDARAAHWLGTIDHSNRIGKRSTLRGYETTQSVSHSRIPETERHDAQVRTPQRATPAPGGGTRTSARGVGNGRPRRGPSS